MRYKRFKSLQTNAFTFRIIKNNLGKEQASYLRTTYSMMDHSGVINQVIGTSAEYKNAFI